MQNRQAEIPIAAAYHFAVTSTMPLDLGRAALVCWARLPESAKLRWSAPTPAGAAKAGIVLANCELRP
jgi:hypothetical protein